MFYKVVMLAIISFDADGINGYLFKTVLFFFDGISVSSI